MKIKKISLLVGTIAVGVLLVGAVLYRLLGLRQYSEVGSPSYSSLKNRADPSSTDPSSAIASLNLGLVEAVKKRDAAQVKVLLARGADPNTRDQSALENWKTKMAMIVTEMDYASGKLRKHPRGEGAQPFRGPTVLMIAAHQNDNMTVKSLADAGADLNARGIDYGAVQASATDVSASLDNHVTALMEAMLSGDTSTMRLLLKKGANVNARDSDGATPLDLANNMTPTSELTSNQQKFFDKIFSILKEAQAKRSQDLKIK